jgi:hypothetical protein
MASRRIDSRLSACLWLGCALLVPWLASSAARAAPSAAERETVRSLLDDGDRLRAAGDLRGALTRYQAAHAIMHVPTTGLELARVQAQLGMLVEARGVAMEVANLPASQAEPRVFGEARLAGAALAAELESQVPSLTTQVTPTSADYQLSIDGASLPVQARSLPFKANPGQHTLRVEAAGYAPETRQVTLEEGQSALLAIALTGVPAPAIAPAPVAAAFVAADGGGAERDRAAAGRTRGAVGLAVGSAVLMTGVVTGAISLAITSKERSRCDQGHCDTTRASALSSANTLANLANIGIPLGLVGIAYGVYELLTLPSADPSRAHRGGIQMAFSGGDAVLRGEL